MGVLSEETLLPFSRLVSEVSLSGLWEGLVLFCAVAVCLRMLPKVSASVRFALWGLTFGLGVALPLISARSTIKQGTGAAEAAIQLAPIWGYAVAGLWLILVAARAGCLLLQALQVRRVWARANPIVGGERWMAPGGRMVTLCTSAEVDSPCVIGFWSPRLLLPERLAGSLTDEEIRQIALHECEHLRRGDDWMNLLQKIGLMLFPLNPALMWMDRRLGLERELACDARVVALTGKPIAYAKCLARLAEHRRQCRHVALSLAAWSRRTELGQRVESLLQPRHSSPARRAAVATIVLSAGLLGGAMEMARVPCFVSFAARPQATEAEARIIGRERSDAVVLPVSYREARGQALASARALMVAAKLPSRATGRMLPSLQRKQRSTGPGGLRRLDVQTPPKLERVSRMFVQPPRFRRASSALTTNDQGGQMLSTFGSEAAGSGNSPTYAAVPFGDGWLIFQL